MSSLITLAELKAQLNITSTQYDVELQAYADSVDAMVEDQIGVVINRSVSEVVKLDDFYIRLPTRPVVSLTSLASLDGSATYDVSQLAVTNGDAGLVERKDGGYISGAAWRGKWTMTYVAGRGVSISAYPTINLAARIIGQHLWETQRGAASRPTMSGTETVQSPGMGFAVPNRAAELLNPYALPPNYL